MTDCPCGSHKNLDDCCNLFISGKKLPATPEELMRSRYTAYTRANVDYIAKTMKSPALDNFVADEARNWAQSVTWRKLQVIKSSIDHDKGFVEFLAHYAQDHKLCFIHEISEFHRIDGQWFYVDGVAPNPKELSQKLTKKVARNDTCPCGSTKKYKKCCGISS